MNSIYFLLAALPVLSSITVILCGKGALNGALVGLVTAILVSLLIPEFAIDSAQYNAGIGTVLILGLSVALVIIPGQLLNRVLQQQNIIKALAHYIDCVQLPKLHKALLLLLGVAPAVESLTGFGVSLFLSVPIIFQLYQGKAAYRTAMLTMNIMPWGTLGLATVVGAGIAGLSIQQLGIYSSITSMAVFPTLGIACLFALGGWQAFRQYAWLAILLGLVFSSLLYINNRWLWVETAGIFSGLGTLIVGVILTKARFEKQEFAGVPLIRALIPYGLLLMLVALPRLIPGAWDWLSNLLILETEHIRFTPFTSPGFALCITAIVIALSQRTKVSIKSILPTVARPIVSIIAFVAMAQIMRESNMLSYVGSTLVGANQTLNVVLSSFLGGVSGFVTGSNVGGNALMMPLQQTLSSGADTQLTILAAIQNSAAGHLVFASIPMILLMTTIAKDLSGPQEVPVASLLKFGLGMSVLIVSVIGVMGIVLATVA